MRLVPLFALALVAASGCHRPHTQGRANEKKVRRAAPQPAVGIDETAIDPSVKPCDDFYQYACGNWLKRTQIPADKAAWTRGFSEIDERNEKELRTILEAAVKGEGGDPYTDKLGAFYAACMDEPKIEATALADLKKLLARLDEVKDLRSLVKEIAYEHLNVANSLFGFGSQQDFKDATQVIGSIDQGGIGLPDRDYYLKKEGKFPELRKAYVAHVQKMLQLAGASAQQATADAQTVLKIETALATASMSRVDRRDPQKIYHRLELAGLQKTAPQFDWKLYLTELGHPDIQQINVASPDFFAALNSQLTKVPLAEWKVYLRWNLIHGAAPALSKAFVDENFAFYAHTLRGVAELEPRWKRCVKATDRALGEALGQAFVRKTFGADGKARTLELIKNIEQAMSKNLETLKWMDAATQKQAAEKLGNIANKIGFPDKWRNYDKLEITRDSYLLNDMHASEFEAHRDLNKIGKPLDRTEWGMTPPTVNAYYNPSMNEMVFPAGILQPPFFGKSAPAAVNYGAIGMVMGHELTHGFDDEGRQFDAKGNLRNWWSPDVNKEFEHRASCVKEQFDGYVAVDDMHINGKLTLGENIADLGGLKLAHAAFVAQRKGAPIKVGKFTDEQLFFLGFAQGWCSKLTPEVARTRVVTDPHSPPQFRVDAPLSNLPEFGAAFQCKPGDKMIRSNQCVVW